ESVVIAQGRDGEGTVQGATTVVAIVQAHSTAGVPSGGVGDLLIHGGYGGFRIVGAGVFEGPRGGAGGDSALGKGAPSNNSHSTRGYGPADRGQLGYGGGGSGASNGPNQSARPGGPGFPGIVIVHLYY